MKCHNFEELLSAYADGELSRTQREFIEEHLVGCPDCREKLAEYETAGRKLHELRECPETADIRGATLAKIKGERSSRPRRWLRPVIAAAATVALAVVLVVVQPWGMRSPEAVAAAIVRESPEVQTALNGQEIKEVEVTTRLVDGEGNVLMMLIRTEERAVAAGVDLETGQVTEVVRVDIPEFEPGDERAALDIAGADARVQELLAQGGVVGEVELSYSLDITQFIGADGVVTKEGKVTLIALLPVELDGQEWNILIAPREGEVLNIGQTQPSKAMILAEAGHLAGTIAAPLLLLGGVLLLVGLALHNKAARLLASVAALLLGLVGLFVGVYNTSPVWWRLALVVLLPALGVVIGITSLRQKTGWRYLATGGIILGGLALAWALFNFIMLPGSQAGEITGLGVIVAAIIIYACKDKIGAIRFSFRWLAPVSATLALLLIAIAAWQFGGFLGMSSSSPDSPMVAAPTITTTTTATTTTQTAILRATPVPTTTMTQTPDAETTKSPPVVITQVPAPTFTVPADVTEKPAPTITIPPVTPSPSEHLGVSERAQMAQFANFLLLLIPVAVIILIVTLDARKKELSGWVTLGWILVSIFFFPVGFLLYFLLQWRSHGKTGNGGA